MAHNTLNFNIYDVLEPLKCPTASSVGVLIDIGNESDSICKNLHGSDLDSVKKSEFDLVDLYQNIYVTPQHVKKNPKKTIEASQIEVFEKFEEKTGLKVLSDEDINELLNGSDKVMPSNSNDKAVLHDDNIQKMDRHTSSFKDTIHDNEMYKVSHELNEGTDKAKDKTMFNCNREISEKIELIMQNGLGDQLLKGADINELARRCYNETSTHEKCMYQNEIRKIDCNRNYGRVNTCKDKSDGLNNINKGESNRQIERHIFGDGIKILKAPKLDEIKINNTLGDSNKNFNTQRILDSTQFKMNEGENSNRFQYRDKNIKPLQTAKLDKKLFARRVMISDTEKEVYTKGPDLYEKSVVLPQIMNRLTARKDQDTNYKRILKLDSGNQTKCQCQSKEKSEPNRKYNISNTNSVETNREVANCGVTLNPIVIMENCNRERLLAHRVRSAFENFVHTGSYF